MEKHLVHMIVSLFRCRYNKLINHGRMILGDNFCEMLGRLLASKHAINENAGFMVLYKGEAIPKSIFKY